MRDAGLLTINGERSAMPPVAGLHPGAALASYQKILHF